MGDENVVLYDETSPLEQSRRSILYYQPRPEETPTYLVELPEKQVDAPRPSTQPAARPRRSTIVNTLQLPDTREAEEQPLEDYVRRNLPSFRRSITPVDLQLLGTSRQAQREGEVVRPATADDIDRYMMDNKKRKSREVKSVDDHEKSDSRPKEKAQKHRVTYKSDSFLEPKTHKRKDSSKREDLQGSKEENTKERYKNISLNQNEHEVVVMPALEPVSVSQRSPFFNDSKSPSSKKHSPIKVKVSVESTDEERFENKKREGKHSSKRDKSDPLAAKIKNSKESDDDSIDRNNDGTKKKQKKRKHRQQSANLTNDSEESKDESKKRRRRERKKKSKDAKRNGNTFTESSGDSSDEDKKRKKSYGKASRSSSVCLSGESGENSSAPDIVNSSSKKERKDSRRNEMSPSKRDKKRTSGSSAKRERKSDDFVNYNRTTNPFGKEEPYSVHYFATKGAVGKKPDEKNKKNKKEDKGKRGEEAVALKAPRSATKVVAMRRYHIQIPEHGRPETWFNVRFNMNAENNVDMNYEGPVKINNYYASNNYL